MYLKRSIPTSSHENTFNFPLTALLFSYLIQFTSVCHCVYICCYCFCASLFFTYSDSFFLDKFMCVCACACTYYDDSDSTEHNHILNQTYRLLILYPHTYMNTLTGKIDFHEKSRKLLTNNIDA